MKQVLVLVALAAASVYLDGFVLMTLWQWFAVEPFGLPAIPSWFVAKGLMLLAALPAVGAVISRQQTAEQLFKVRNLDGDGIAELGRKFVWRYVSMLLFILGIGWIFRVLA